jgi:hypothetical protein
MIDPYPENEVTVKADANLFEIDKNQRPYLKWFADPRRKRCASDKERNIYPVAI